MLVENVKVTFEIDTGSRISAISKSFYDRYFSHLPITRDNNKFHSYTREAIVPLGHIAVNVQTGDAASYLSLFIIDNGGPPLLGRNWLRELKLNSISLHSLSTKNDPVVMQLKLDFPEVFNPGLGSCKRILKLYLKDDLPIFCKVRVWPLAMRAPVECELERLQREQVVYKVERSDYGTPIVPVVKRDGSIGIRLCGDYKLTLNKVLKDDHDPLPRVEQLFAALNECFKDGVCYLGYRIDKHGLYTDKSKVEAIAKAPVPQNASQLQAALGLINYYARFIPNMSTLLQPLYALLKKGTKCQWSRECDTAYCAAKEVLTRSRVQAHCDTPERPLVLSVDSSSYGLDAVVFNAHAYPDGSARVVCCALRTLTPTKCKHSQVEKDALAIVYSVTQHQYVYGRRFTLKTDPMALSHILFGPKQGIPQTAAGRLQRYAVRLTAYDFDIKFVSSKRNADALSRLPLHEKKVELEHDDAVYLHLGEDSFPLSHRHAAKAIENDPVLRQIYGYLMSGWLPTTEIENKKPHCHRKEDFHLDHGCIVWGYRMVITSALRASILHVIHSGHQDVERMKQIGRNYVWWPLLDTDIEARARDCAACSAVRDAPPRAPPLPYAWPTEPWARLHADYSQFGSKRYFLIHSKWIEVFTRTVGTTANKVVSKLRKCFARLGCFRVQMIS